MMIVGSNLKLHQLHQQLGSLLSRANALHADDVSEDLVSELIDTEEDLAEIVARLEAVVPAAPPPPPSPSQQAPPPPPPPSIPPRRPIPEHEMLAATRVREEKALGYQWREPGLWLEARDSKRQRLAMVGDAAVDLLLVCDGYRLGLSPADIARMKSCLASNRNLTALGQNARLDMGLGGDELVGKCVADQIEALIGAIYLDSSGNLCSVRQALWRMWMYTPSISSADTVAFGAIPTRGKLLSPQGQNGFWSFAVEKGE